MLLRANDLSDGPVASSCAEEGGGGGRAATAAGVRGGGGGKKMSFLRGKNGRKEGRKEKRKKAGKKEKLGPRGKMKLLSYTVYVFMLCTLF